MLRKIYLHGGLAKTFGSEPIEFKATHPRDVLKALSLRHRGFMKELRRYPDVAIMTKRGDEVAFIPAEELSWTLGNWPEVHVGAGIQGAGTGAEAVYAYFIEAGYSSYAAFAIATVYTIAVSVVISSIMQSLADTPQTEEKANSVKSTLFNGPENRTNQGGRVQLGYGLFRVDSYTVNQDMYAVRMGLGAADTISVQEGNSASKNVFTNDYHLTSPMVTSFTINGTTTSAGGTWTNGAGVDITGLSDGTFTVDSTGMTPDGAALEFTVDILSADGATAFNQKLTVSISPDWNRITGGGAGGGDASGDAGGDGTAGDG